LGRLTAGSCARGVRWPEIPVIERWARLKIRDKSCRAQVNFFVLVGKCHNSANTSCFASTERVRMRASNPGQGFPTFSGGFPRSRGLVVSRSRGLAVSRSEISRRDARWECKVVSGRRCCPDETANQSGFETAKRGQNSRTEIVERGQGLALVALRDFPLRNGTSASDGPTLH
jgi:hypothetical protein